MLRNRFLWKRKKYCNWFFTISIRGKPETPERNDTGRKSLTAWMLFVINWTTPCFFKLAGRMIHIYNFFPFYLSLQNSNFMVLILEAAEIHQWHHILWKDCMLHVYSVLSSVNLPKSKNYTVIAGKCVQMILPL